MRMTNSSNRSQKNSDSWLDLDLPTVTEESAPIEHEPPSSILAFRHSLELLRSLPDSVWEERRAAMNPQRFVFFEG